MYQSIDFYYNWYTIGTKGVVLMNEYNKQKKLGSADIASKIRREVLSGNLKFKEKLPNSDRARSCTND